ncbi:MAG: M6 family metalloprotease domain-containing protein [Bacillota bacterium]
MVKRLVVLASVLFVIIGFTSGMAQAMPAHPALERQLKKEHRWDALMEELSRLREAGGIDRPAKVRRSGFPVKRVPGPLGIGLFTSGESYSASAASPVLPAAETLVIMVDFSDKPGVLDREGFEELFFGTGSGTARDYFSKNSCGTFLLTGNVSGGPEGGQQTVWLRMPQNLAYYANNNYGIGGYPQNSQKLAEDAVNLLKAAGFDWTPYRAADGTVPYLCILHAGQGAEVTGQRSDLWSCSWNLSQPVTVDTSAGQATISDFILIPEEGVDPGVRTTIGVFCHEFGHALGLPDLYDTSERTEGGVGDWSLMASGAWLGAGHDGSVPASLDAFSRSFFNWVVPETPSTGGAGVSVAPAATSAFVYGLYPGGDTSETEYFLVENRQHLDYDTYLPGEGLLIWRVDAAVMNPGSSYWQYNQVNNLQVRPYPGLQVVEADNDWEMVAVGGGNRGEAEDPFPGTAGNTSFTPFSAPDSNRRDGTPTAISLYRINTDGDNVGCDLSMAMVSLVPSTITAGYPGPLRVAVYGSGTHWLSAAP